MGDLTNTAHDSSESTIVGADVNYVIRISTSNVVIDGITVTSSTLKGFLYGIKIDPTSSSNKFVGSLTNVVIRNCVIRHLGSPESTSYKYMISISGDVQQAVIS